MARTLNYKNGLWLGTQEYQQWVPMPRRGADITAQSFDEAATGLSGGGYLWQSKARHRQYQYDWGPSTPRWVGQYIQALRDGVYGDGPIYFVDPSTYRTNVLPAQWAAPGLTANFEYPPLTHRGRPLAKAAGISSLPQTPTKAATYRNIPNRDAMFAEDPNLSKVGVRIPLPPDMTLLVGARWSYPGQSGADLGKISLFAGSWHNQSLIYQNEIQPHEAIWPGEDPYTYQFQTAITNFPGGEPVNFGGLALMSNNPAVNAATFTDMTAVLVPTAEWDKAFAEEGMQGIKRFNRSRWYSGEGNSGCRILGQPTIQETGQDMASVSVTFKETGAWELASRL